MRWSPHPFWKIPTRAQAEALRAQGETGLAKLREIWEAREERIRLEAVDPLRYGVRLDPWERAKELMVENGELLILGGNRASKSEFCAAACVECLVEGPWWLQAGERQAAIEHGVRVGMLHSSEQSSVNQQHPLLYRWLPPEWRDVGKKGKVTNVRYTKATGFSNAKFILPNGGEGLFFNYRQDPGVLEGYEFDLVWCDELVPIEFIEALRWRLVTRGGRLVVGFTPVRGFTPTVKQFLAGATTRVSLPVDGEVFADGDGERIHEVRLARGCPKGHVPVVMDGKVKGQAITFFHSRENPFNPYENVLDKCRGKSRAERLIRAYGYTERSEAGALARFNRAAHVITRERFEALRAQGGTVYVCADPGGAKPWTIKWYLVTREGWSIVFKEWPDYQTYGWWAEPGLGVDWKPGPAQKAAYGGGLLAVKEVVLEAEGWVWDESRGLWVEGPEVILPEVRLIDPRMGGMVAPSDEDETSICMIMEEEQVDASGRVVGPSMVWEPARAGGSRPGRSAVAVSIELLNERLDYNEDEKVTALNCPKWFVVEDCVQTILAYEEFTGMGTDKDALKDIIDPDRYFVNGDFDYVEPGGSWNVAGVRAY